MRVSPAPREPSPGAAAEGGESTGSSAELQLALVSLSTISRPSLPQQGPGCTRGKEKTEEKQGEGDENEYKESTRSVLGQRRQRCLKESVHANWKCQGDLGTCIRALGNSNSSSPRLAHSPFHAGLVHSQVTQQAPCPCNSLVCRKAGYGSHLPQEGPQAHPKHLALAHEDSSSSGTGLSCFTQT